MVFSTEFIVQIVCNAFQNFGTAAILELLKEFDCQNKI